MRTALVTPPAGPPVTLEDVRGWLAFAESVREDDPIVELVIDEVTRYIERRTNRRIVNQTWAAWFDLADLETYDTTGSAGYGVAINGGDMVRLPLFPTASVTTVHTYDADGVETEMADGYVARVGDYPIVIFESVPSGLRSIDAIKVEAVIGYGEPEELDPEILMLVKGLVLHQYQTKGSGYQATVTGQLVSIPNQYRDIMDDLRVRFV